MKTHLRKLISTAVVGLTLCSNGASAWAGVAARYEVTINSEFTIARGSLTGARYSADSEQYIGCSVKSNLYNTSDTITCYAQDKSGRGFICIGDDARLVDAIKGMTDSSYVEIGAKFQGRNPTCTDLTITNDSIILP